MYIGLPEMLRPQEGFLSRRVAINKQGSKEIIAAAAEIRLPEQACGYKKARKQGNYSCSSRI